MSFKVTIKNGTTSYNFNAEAGKHDTKVIDLVEEFEGLSSALAEFLYYIDSESGNGDDKVSLTYIPKNKKGKK